MRLRGRRLTGTSGAGLPSLRLAAVFQPAFPAPPAQIRRLSSQARRGHWWAGENAAPGIGLAAPPSHLPAVSPKSLALSLRFQQSSFSFSFGVVADPDQPLPKPITTVVMSNPGIPASGGALTGHQAQNGAASASGSPYTNGPIQNALMSSQVSVSQGYNSQLPGSYPHLIPAKTLNPVSGQSTCSGSQTVSPLSNYQGPGQTLYRPPVASNPVTPSLHSGPVPRMPQSASQNTTTTPMPSGSFLPGANVPPPLNWQHNYPSAGSQTNHYPRASSGPTMSGHTNLTATHQYISSGDPSLQNNFIKPGRVLLGELKI